MRSMFKYLFICLAVLLTAGSSFARGFDPLNGDDSTRNPQANLNASNTISSTNANVVMVSEPKAPHVYRNYNAFLGNSNIIGLYNDNDTFARIDAIIVRKYPSVNGNLIGIKSGGSVIFAGSVGQPSTITFVNNPSIRTINQKSTNYLEFIFSNGASYATCYEYSYTIVYDDGSSNDYSVRKAPIAGFGFSCN